jgi:hypothetical protein
MLEQAFASQACHRLLIGTHTPCILPDMRAFELNLFVHGKNLRSLRGLAYLRLVIGSLWGSSDAGDVEGALIIRYPGSERTLHLEYGRLVK